MDFYFNNNKKSINLHFFFFYQQKKQKLNKEYRPSIAQHTSAAMKAKMVGPNLKPAATQTPSRAPEHAINTTSNPSNFTCDERGVVGENDNWNKKDSP